MCSDMEAGARALEAKAADAARLEAELGRSSEDVKRLVMALEAAERRRAESEAVWQASQARLSELEQQTQASAAELREARSLIEVPCKYACSINHSMV
jgi:chromosome segregation ATPase